MLRIAVVMELRFNAQQMLRHRVRCNQLLRTNKRQRTVVMGLGSFLRSTFRTALRTIRQQPYTPGRICIHPLRSRFNLNHFKQLFLIKMLRINGMGWRSKNRLMRHLRRQNFLPPHRFLLTQLQTKHIVVKRFGSLRTTCLRMRRRRRQFFPPRRQFLPIPILEKHIFVMRSHLLPTTSCRMRHRPHRHFPRIGLFQPRNTFCQHIRVKAFTILTRQGHTSPDKARVPESMDMDVQFRDLAIPLLVA